MTMKTVRRIVSLTMAIVLLVSMHGMAASSGDENFISAYEFLETKVAVRKQIDKYNDGLDNHIDKTIDRYKARMDVGASEVVFNKLFPIGIEIVSSIKPGIGTWIEVSDMEGRALWLSSGTSWGTTIAQKLPGNINFENAGGTSTDTHNHTFTGITSATGTATIASHGSLSISLGTGTVSIKAGDKPGKTTSTNVYGPTAGSHKHTIKPTGIVSDHKPHTHEITYPNGLKTFNEVSEKVQPNAIAIKIWRRIE